MVTDALCSIALVSFGLSFPIHKEALNQIKCCQGLGRCWGPHPACFTISKFSDYQYLAIEDDTEQPRKPSFAGGGGDVIGNCGKGLMLQVHFIFQLGHFSPVTTQAPAAPWTR